MRRRRRRQYDEGKNREECSVCELTVHLLCWPEVGGKASGHVHSNKVGSGGCDNLKDVGWSDGVEFRVHHLIHSQDVC